MFCPKCGLLMKPKKQNDKKVMVCSCGFVDKKPEAVKLSEDVKQGKGIEVVEQLDYETLPMMKAECPKCGHMKAYYWLQQTRAGDEAETRFLKCEKCKHNWREYD